MKSQISFEYFLPGNASQISLYFSNFIQFGKHHPYMVEVNKMESNVLSNNVYHVKESLKLWGVFPMKPSYNVNVILNESEKSIKYQAALPSGIFLNIDYSFVEDLRTNTVKIIESIEVIGYPILNTLFIGILKKSRGPLIESIRKELEINDSMNNVI